MSRPVRFYSNWEILAEMVRHPRRYWRSGQWRLNGWWFRNPFSSSKG